jgi:membrane protein
VAASWIAVEAADNNETLRRMTPEQLVAEELALEKRALVTAARVRVREARQRVAESTWLVRFAARRQLARAENELALAEASVAPGPAQNDVGGLP